MTDTMIQAPSAGSSAPRFQMKLAVAIRMTSDRAVLLTVPPSVICSVPGTARTEVNVSAVSAGLPDRIVIALAMVGSWKHSSWRLCTHLNFTTR